MSFGSATYSVGEGGRVTVTVVLSADPKRSVTIPLTAANQDRATSAEYSGVPPNVAFTSGERSKTFTLSAADDSIDDDGESVALDFGTLPTGVRAGTVRTSTVNITDYDGSGVTILPASLEIDEGATGTYTRRPRLRAHGRRHGHALDIEWQRIHLHSSDVDVHDGQLELGAGR